MFPAMSCQNCNAANTDALYCSLAIILLIRFLDIVPNTPLTSTACFMMTLWRGITKICRSLIDYVLLHSSCLMTDVLQNVVLF